MRGLSLVVSALVLVSTANSVTIYTTFTTDANGNAIKPTNTNTATGPAYSGFGAYNMTTLTAPALPNPLPNLNIPVQLFAGGMDGLSIPQKGNFMGFSVELSVANLFLGRNSTRLNVPFLNYIATLRSRMGQGPIIRVGGNSQEHTELYDTPFDDHYEITNKTLNTNPLAPTVTPEVNVYIDLLYTLLNITTLTSAQWYLGLPFGYPVNVTGIVEMAKIYEDVLGDNLIALQLGNEPDLYGQQNRGRPTAYPVTEYMTEYGTVTQAMKDGGVQRQDILLSPSVCCNLQPGGWSIQDVLDGGLLTTYGDSVSQLAVQRYPRANCDGSVQAEVIFPDYLLHGKIVDTLSSADYVAAAATAVSQGKPLVMFETNTASCSGFPGLSDSFAATLWAVDWTLQLAYRNFSTALFHFGGQDASYNAFTPPPSNYSASYQWSTGAIYYSMLMVAEALGGSNTSQVLDLGLNDNSDVTPGYVIYENGQPQRVLIINYMNDGGSGAGAYTAYIHIGGTGGLADTTPTTVTVRYMAAPTVTEKQNITWASQTMGTQFNSDGRIQGEAVTETITCAADTGCPIRVPAPGAALVFLSQTAEDESTNPALTQTFPTTFFSQGGPTVDQAVLETSNGRGGPNEKGNPYGGTSHGMDNGAMAAGSVSLALSAVAIAVGAAMVGRMLTGGAH